MREGNVHSLRYGFEDNKRLKLSIYGTLLLLLACNTSACLKRRPRSPLQGRSVPSHLPAITHDLVRRSPIFQVAEV
jgi:hypothetical protein